MRTKRLDHVGIAVKDLATAEAFLEGLGLKCSAHYEVSKWLTAAFFELGDVAVALIQMDDPEVSRRRLKGESLARIDHLCFEVESLDESVKELKARGVRVSAGEFESWDSADSEEQHYGSTRSVFTEAETSSGYVLQFIETKAGGVAKELAQAAEPGSPTDEARAAREPGGRRRGASSGKSEYTKRIEWGFGYETDVHALVHESHQPNPKRRPPCVRRTAVRS